MQVTQTLSDGLKREFKVVLPAKDLADRLAAQLEDLKDKVQIKGFRPGKVPASHLRRVYGRSVMGDLVQELVNEGNRRIIEEHKVVITKKNEHMAFIKIADFTGSIEVVVFPRTLAEVKDMLGPDKMVAVKGRFSRRNDSPSVVAEKVKALE